MTSSIEVLKNVFGYTTFRPGQERVIEQVLKGRNVLAVMPTGAGKSMCYQIPALVNPGVTLVISPLISLMKDQIDSLKQNGINAAALNSATPQEEVNPILRQAYEGKIKLLYITPERLAMDYFRYQLNFLDISLVAVDEAHCISQWGHDFRPAYRQIMEGVKSIKSQPNILALTATATPSVQKDKLEKLFDLLNTIKGPGLIYFSSKKKANEITEKIKAKTSLKVAAYHADLDMNDRFIIQHQFLDNKLDLICATSAFGMGINKENIRYVIHYHLPGELESYIQEIGRAGRDGKQSIAILLYQKGDEGIQQQLSLNNIPDNQMIDYYINNKQQFAETDNESIQLLNKISNLYSSKEELQSFFLQRKRQKFNSLQQMLQYVDTNECRRQYILDYFEDNKKIDHHELCCQKLNDDLPLKELGLIFDENEQKSLKIEEFYKIIDEIFRT